MIFEQKVKLASTAALALIAAAAWAMGTWKAVEGSTIYMMSAEGHSHADALIYAAMVAACVILASNASVFMSKQAHRVAFAGLAIVLAVITIYMTHAGKKHDSDAKVEAFRANDRAIITAEISNYQQIITRLNDSLAKNSESPLNSAELPTATSCNPSAKNFSRCNEQRTKQLQANAAMTASLSKGSDAVREQLQLTAIGKKEAENKLAGYDQQTNALKQQKRHDSLLTNAISSVMPELASLLGSFLFSFALKTMWLIYQEKHLSQLALQSVAVGVAARCSDLQQPETGATRSEVEQWSVVPTMSLVQQQSSTPLGAEQEFSAAIDDKTAPLSSRPAKIAYPSISTRRIADIFEIKFYEKLINCRIDGKGNRNWEYPEEGEDGGKTLYTETARARLETVKPRAIYLATHNGATA